MTSTNLPRFQLAEGMIGTPTITIDAKTAAGLEALVNNRPFVNPYGTRTITSLATVMDASIGVADVALPAISGGGGALEVVSSSALDTGVYASIVHYIDGEGFYRAGFGLLTGTTPAAILSSDGSPILDAVRVNHVFVINVADSDTPNVGDVAITIGGAPQRNAPAGSGIPDGAQWTNPRGFQALLEFFDIATDTLADVRLEVRFPLGGQDGSVDAKDTQQTSWVRIARVKAPPGTTRWSFAVPFTIPALADARFRAVSIAGTSEVTILPGVTFIATDPTFDPNPELQPEIDD